MLIRNGKAFTRGLLLMASFIFVFVLFFLNIFPDHTSDKKGNGLQYADNLFNTLSKGSANYFDKNIVGEEAVSERAQGVKGKIINLEVPFKNAAQLPLAAQAAKNAGLDATVQDNKLKIQGDLYTLLTAVITDANSMYDNKAADVATRHNTQDGKAVVKAWWNLTNGMIKPLQKAGQVEEASIVAHIVTKGIEPAYNFYGIQPLQVVDNIPLVAGFLIFYVVYTMWYGFAIFELFEGIGLSMKKGVKKEV